MSLAETQLEISRPPHVSPDRVLDYDFFEDRRHPATSHPHHALYRLGQDEGRGIFWTPRNGGHWIINDYELLFDAARRPELFSSTVAMLPRLPRELEPRLIPIGLDPPEHSQFRIPLMRAFAPAKVNALKADIRAFAGELIDQVAEEGRCDFVAAIAEPLPVVTFMKLMGMDLARLREFRGWLYEMLSKDDDLRLGAHRNIKAMMSELIEQRRVKREDDLISELVHAEVDGGPVSADDLQSYCLVLFGAGLDTVANALSFSMHHLAADPQLQARLRADPALIPSAVEEFLRLFGVANVVRIVTADAEFGGVTLRAGDPVLLMLPAGNYDPKIFSDPATFRLDREDKPHLSFNTGPHRCVGSHLARLELEQFYEEWFGRIPEVSLDRDQPVVFHTTQTLGVRSLPIVWDAADTK